MQPEARERSGHSIIDRNRQLQEQMKPKIMQPNNAVAAKAAYQCKQRNNGQSLDFEKLIPNAHIRGYRIIQRLIILPKMALFDEVDDEFKLMVCAAYGDLKGILSYTGPPPEQDANALMAAVANHQTDAADLLKTKFPHLSGNTPEYLWRWRQATHTRNKNAVYLPYASL
eukprot:TRINITY_DN2913_c0_g2_i8.p1 TRINITY_DN2913_c0_g2~~TRINITY_DN2913_c0_g2_i8.p1  ORF type:complete len:170 (+),score=18.68 TRINITY_DN2913_c0_g2_i8:458-967(+)